MDHAHGMCVSVCVINCSRAFTTMFVIIQIASLDCCSGRRELEKQKLRSETELIDVLCVYEFVC